MRLGALRWEDSGGQCYTFRPEVTMGLRGVCMNRCDRSLVGEVAWRLVLRLVRDEGVVRGVLAESLVSFTSAQMI